MPVSPIEIAALAGIVFFSVVLHEVSHGAVAFSLGDPTAKALGRLTLNPFRHIDPLGTVILPVILYASHAGVIFGWAKPVPFDPRYFKNRPLGTLVVALAGPLTNVFLAAIFALLLKFSGGPEALPGKIFYLGAGINLFLALFNLIPIPPLDGSKVLAAILPRPLRGPYLRLESWGMILILVLLFTGFLMKGLVPFYTRLLGQLTS